MHKIVVINRVEIVGNVKAGVVLVGARGVACSIAEVAVALCGG
jgi:hypothetical protein